MQELTGPSGESVSVPDALAKRISSVAFDPELGSNWSEEDLPELLKSDLSERARKIANERLEHATVMTSDRSTVYRAVGKEDQVSIPIEKLAGNILIHNHPSGTPLSIQDLANMIEHGMESVWAVGVEWIYGASPRADPGRGSGDLRFLAKYLDGAIYAVIASLDRNGLISTASAVELEDRSRPRSSVRACA